MDQPLGVAIGHAREVIEAFAALRQDGRLTGPRDLVTLTEELTAEMICGAGLRDNRAQARALVQRVWDSGEAFALLERWVAAQHGRIDPERNDFGLALAPPILEAEAPDSGYLQKVDCRAVGRSLVEIGGARRVVDDPIDPSVGVDFRVRVGDRLVAGQAVATVYSREREAAERTARRITSALTIGPDPVAPRTLVIDRLGADSSA
jgi:thymidine phosphorylase